MTDRLGILDRLADEAVTVVAIGALVVVTTQANADPTTVVTAIGGLGGYRLHKRGGRPQEGS